MASESHQLRGLLRLDQHRTYWALSSFVIDSTQRGRGYGEQMLRHVILNLDQERIALRVVQDNEAAIRLYQKNHFQVTDQQNGRLLMELR